ncbi:MAG: hypothetical protein ACHREM_15825 [Polyangiales bacterium]
MLLGLSRIALYRELARSSVRADDGSSTARVFGYVGTKIAGRWILREGEDERDA